jgi:hypothetical protein
MKTLIKLLLGSIALVALVAAPANAAQAPKTAKFKASLKGEQTITWSYDRAPEAPCYGGENAGGSVRMFYKSDKTATVTAYQIKKNSPIWDSTHQRVFFTPGPQLSASATFEGTHSSGPPPNPDQCDPNGGGVEEQPNDCGTATTLINTDFSYVNKDRFLVKGDAMSWDPGFQELRNMWMNCPYWEAGPYSHDTAEGDLDSADANFKESKLFDANGPKKIVLHGSQNDCYEEAGFTSCGAEEGPFRGHVINAWTLTLKRVK